MKKSLIILAFLVLIIVAANYYSDVEKSASTTQSNIISPLSIDWRKDTKESIDAYYTAFRPSYMNDGSDLIATYDGPLESEITELDSAEIIRYVTIPVTHECLLKPTTKSQQQCVTDLATYEVAASAHTQADYDTYYNRCQTIHQDQRDDQVLMSICALAYFTNLDRCELFFVAGVIDYDWCVFARNDFNQNYFDTKLATLIADIEKGNESIGNSDTAQRVHAGALALPDLLRQYDTIYREQRRRECELTNWHHMTSAMGTSWIETCANNIQDDYEDRLNKVREQYFSSYPLDN